MGIKLSTRISAGADDCTYLSIFYYYDPCKITNFSLYLYIETYNLVSQKAGILVLKSCSTVCVMRYNTEWLGLNFSLT